MKKPRLLLVDDEHMTCELAVLDLERVGQWDVTSVGSGVEALELRGGGERFDAIVLDAKMPGLDGPATLEWLRADGLPEATPVVFLTTDLEPADRALMDALGVAGAIAKPFDSVSLAGELEKIIEAQPAGGETVSAELIWAWRRAVPAIDQRLIAIDAALGTPVDRACLAAAVGAAHVLAGVLGTFGLRRGTQLAREIEVGLEQGGLERHPDTLHTLAVELRLAVEAGRTSARCLTTVVLPSR
jgi:CheY-like chemotaxis protein